MTTLAPAQKSQYGIIGLFIAVTVLTLVPFQPAAVFFKQPWLCCSDTVPGSPHRPSSQSRLWSLSASPQFSESWCLWDTREPNCYSHIIAGVLTRSQGMLWLFLWGCPETWAAGWLQSIHKALQFLCFLLWVHCPKILKSYSQRRRPEK